MSEKFSWYPGHMKKALEAISEEIKSATAFIFVLDSRCPFSSLNPSLEKITGKKPVLYVLNKSDLASAGITQEWIHRFEQEGRQVITLSCKSRSGRKSLLAALRHFREISRKTGKNKILGNTMRVIIMGVPNSGKSSIINILSPTASVKTGKKPGLTRGKQWLKIGDDNEILDSPGIMPPRMDHIDTGWVLGATGAIKQEILPIEYVASKFLAYLAKRDLFPEAVFPANYNRKELQDLIEEAERTAEKPKPPRSGKQIIDEIPDIHAISGSAHLQQAITAIIEDFATKRGFFIKGSEPDGEKASLQILKMFREGKLGKISLETP
ncbi:MAG: ribosome biogenesis GTPase YlqF [Firmicutes bacterium]|nr:ribosome biogenesis GTPase YlqF [Bacillota bacterium]